MAFVLASQQGFAVNSRHYIVGTLPDQTHPTSRLLHSCPPHSFGRLTEGQHLKGALQDESLSSDSAVAWQVKGPSDRVTIYAQDRAWRSSTPDGLRSGILQWLAY